MTDENQELRKAGLKVTLPRLKILQILESSEDGPQHMSAEDVYRALRAAGRKWGWRRCTGCLTQFQAPAWWTAIILRPGTRYSELAKASITTTWCARAPARSSGVHRPGH